MSEQLEAAAALWGLADYRGVADKLMPAARAIADLAGPGRDRSALDVAAGTGNVAVALRERGWEVAATDVSPRMVDLGRERTGDEVGWRVAPAERLPVEDASCDLVASAFGLIFAADVDAAVGEVHRALRPGGRLVLTAWVVDDYMASMTDVMMAYLPTPTGPTPMDWGARDVIHRRLSAFGEVRVERRTLPWHFDSPAAGRAFYEASSPAHVGSMRYAGERAGELMDAVEEHLAERAEPSGQVRIAAGYLLVSATR
ncbi:MAG: methyltransferase domain-containing protein [Actinomycetota bacterium]|nr:methyltransferase domain-containing protein [Actinomycetota bacterium]